MEDEIELRPYIELLLKRWYLIIGAAVLAGVVAFVISSLLPPTYQTTALVAITEPRLRVQFEPRIEELTEETQPLGAFPELATSDELLQELVEEINPSLGEMVSLDELREIVEARSGSDPTLVRLSANFGDPNEAALVANTWAGLFVTRANEIFGENGEGLEQFFIDQLAGADAELSAAEEALISFEALNRSSIIDSQLASLRLSHQNYYTSTLDIALLVQDIEGLRDQLNTESGGVVTLADQITILALQLEAFDADTPLPLQLQLESTESLTTRDREQQVTYLASLIATLETRLEQIDETMAGLEPQILSLQEQRQEMETESARLNRDLDVANETYMALARKVEEERISTDASTSVVSVASEAAVPEKAVGPRRTVNAGAAFVVALGAGIVAILIFNWYHSDTSEDVENDDQES